MRAWKSAFSVNDRAHLVRAAAHRLADLNAEFSLHRHADQCAQADHRVDDEPGRFRRVRKVDAKSISITATPPNEGSVEFEPFEFFEMGGEIELTFDRENGLPLKISGEIRGLGRVDFVLSEVSQRR